MSVRTDSIDQLLAGELHRLLRQQHALSLVPALLSALGCAHQGIDLIWWLEQPRARDNLDALCAWVECQLEDKEFWAAKALQPEQTLLLERLDNCLAGRDPANDERWEVG